VDSEERTEKTSSRYGALPAMDANVVTREAVERPLQEALALQEPGIVVLEGADGMGKTTLMAQVATRMGREQPFEYVVYTGFGGGGLAEMALRDLAGVLLGESDAHAPVPKGRLEEALTEHPTLICWDDIDAVFGEGPMALSDGMQQELVALARRLASLGSTRVLLGCARLPKHPSLSASSVERIKVRGLAAEEAVELWTKWGYTDQLADDDVQRLASLLGGNPLALRLAGYTAGSRGLQAVERALEKALPGFAQGEGRMRNQGLHAAMEAWLQQIPDVHSEALAPLGVFAQGFVANLPALVGDTPNDSWAKALGVLVRSGLARTYPIEGLKVPYIRVHQALLSHLSRHLDQAQAMRFRSRYAGNYVGLARWMIRNRDRAAEAVRNLRRYEMPNLRRILPDLIASGEMGMAREFTRDMADLLQGDGLPREASLVREAIGRAISQLLQQRGPLSRAEVNLLIGEADSLIGNRHLGEAGMLLHQACDRFRDEKGISYSGPAATLDHARACRRLGHALIALHQADLALSPLVQAEELLSKLEGQLAIGEEIVDLALDLAPLYASRDQADKARDLLERALPVAQEAERHEDVARLRQQLAAGALRAEDSALAEEHLLEALEVLDEGSEALEAEAALRDQLAGIAVQRDDPDNAIQLLEQAVALYRDQENRPAEASALVRLAGLLRERGHLSEAEKHLARAASLYQEANQRSALAAVELDLAQLLLDQRRSAEARVHAEAARALLENRKTQGPVWRAYQLLDELDRDAGNLEASKRWHGLAIDAYVASGAARALVAQWGPLLSGLVRASHGQALDNDIVLALEEMERDQDWQDAVDVFWRILGGERGDELYLGLDVRPAALVKALLAGIEALELKDHGPAEEQAPSVETQAESRAGGLPREMQAMIQRVFVTVMQAIRGDPNAQFVAGMLLGTLQQKGHAEPIVQYAHAMERILAGERDDALAQGLPGELAEPVRALLRALEKGPSPTRG
jgi:tetratricopeptide (TPR) repeat protein